MAENNEPLQDPKNGGDAGNVDPNAGSGEGTPSGEGDAGEGASKSQEPEDIKALLEARDQEIQQLRQLLRENRQEINGLQQTVQGSITALDKAGLIPEEDKAATQNEDALVAQREHELDMILEMTRLNPKYEDVDTVVNQKNFDDAVEKMAEEYARTNAVNGREAAQTVEAWVWSKANPYRFMYDYIKKNVLGTQTPASKGKAKPADAPGSLQNVGSGGSVDAGWTAAKIDALPEDQLSKVPRDLYEMYLRNELK